MKKIISDIHFPFLKFIVRRQSLWSLGSQGLSALAGMIVFAITSSRLNKEDFGVYVLFVSMSALMDMFKTGLLFPGFLQQAAGSSKHKKKIVFYSVAVFFSAVTLIQALLCYILSLLVNDQSSWNFFFTFYPLSMLSGAVLLLNEWWLQVNHRFHSILVLRVINRSVLVITVFLFLKSKTDLIYLTAISNAIVSVIVMSMGALPKIQWNQLSHEISSKLMWFAKFAAPSQLASNLLRSSDTFLINRFLGNAATGIYGVAARFLEFVELPIRSAGAVHYNQIARLIKSGEALKALHLSINHAAKTTVKILPIAVMLGVMAPYLIRWLSGEQYADSVSILQIMAVYCLLIPADRYIGLFLEASGRPDLNMVKVIAMLILNVIADMIAIMVFKTPFAVAMTSIITFTLGVCLGVWFVMTKSSAVPSSYSGIKLLLSKP